MIKIKMIKIIISIILILIILIIAYVLYRKYYYNKLYKRKLYEEKKKSENPNISASDDVELRNILRIPSYEKTLLFEKLIQYSQNIEKIDDIIKEEIAVKIKKEIKNTGLANKIRNAKTKEELISVLKKVNDKINNDKINNDKINNDKINNDKINNDKINKEKNKPKKEIRKKGAAENLNNKEKSTKHVEGSVSSASGQSSGGGSEQVSGQGQGQGNQTDIKTQKEDSGTKSLSSLIRKGSQILNAIKEDNKKNGVNPEIDEKLPNNGSIKSIKELVEFLRKIDEKTYKYYLENDSKHFLAWLREVTGINYNTELYKIKKREDLIKLLKENLVESLKEEYLEIKKKISELRKKGKDVKLIDIKATNIPAKIQIAEATLEEKDVETAKRLIKDIKESLSKLEDLEKKPEIK